VKLNLSAVTDFTRLEALWRDLEDRSEYPTELVAELTAGGFLAALIPQRTPEPAIPRMPSRYLAPRASLRRRASA